MAVSSWVESVEFVDAYIDSSSNSISVPLTKGQNYENCIPFYTIHGAQDYWDCRLSDCYFSGTTESGVINFERYAIRSSNVVYIKCYVVEFNPEQVRVQQGSFNTDTTATDSITLSTTLSGIDRAFMTFGWKANDGSQYPARVFVRGRVVDNNTVDFYRNNTTNLCNGHWFLAEDLGNNFRVTHGDSSYTDGNDTIVIDNGRTVDPLRTFLLGSHASNRTDTYASRWSTRIFLYSNGTIYSDKSDGSYGTIYWAVQVVEFQDKDKVYTPFDHYVSGNNNGNTSWDRVVGGVDDRVPFTCNMESSSIAYAMMQGLARGTSSETAQIDQLMVSSELTSSGTITFRKNSTGYDSYTSYTTAIDWAGIDIDTGENLSPIPEGTGPGESFVKSVENFRMTVDDYFGARVLTKGQVVENCAIFSSHRCDGGEYVRDNTAAVYLVDPGIVCVKRWTPTGQLYVDVSVVEFHPAQVKVQHKNIATIGNSTSNITIDEVQTDRAFILSKEFCANNSYQPRYTFSRVRFTSSTNVETYVNVANTHHDISIFVVEDLKDNFRTYHESNTWTSGSWSLYNSDRHWARHNTFHIVSYASAGTSDYPSRNFIRAYYNDEYRPVYSSKNDASYHNIYENVTVVQLLSNKKTVHNLTYSLASIDTVTTTYTEDFLDHTEITAFMGVQQSTLHTSTSASAAAKEAFATVQITDYDNRTIEITKDAASYNSYGGCTVIDWIGMHYQDHFGYTGFQTRSLINSLQKFSYYGTIGAFNIPLKYGQNVNQVVPFHNFHCGEDLGNPYRDTRTIWRYDNPDFFTVRMGSNGTTDRRHMIYLVEFNSDIKVQHGSAMTTGASVQVTIDEVNLNRAFLHFYSKGDSGEDYLRSFSVGGRFVDSTTIEFNRGSTAGSMEVSWYIVECPEEGDASHWYVHRDYSSNLGGGGNVYLYPGSTSQGRTLYLVSYGTNTSSYYPSRSCYRAYNRQDHAFVLNKSDSSYYDALYAHAQAIEFNTRWAEKGLRINSGYVTLGATVPITQSFYVPEHERIFIPRAMLITANEQNEAHVSTSAQAGLLERCHYYEFIDDGDSYSSSFKAYKQNSAHNTYSYYYAIQWPEFNKYYFSGYTTEEGDPVSREVSAYVSSTGEVVDTTMSVSGTGYFYLETPYYAEHHVVCLDDAGGISYNHLIYGKLYPTVISGCFAYQKDITMTSGIVESEPDFYEE